LGLDDAVGIDEREDLAGALGDSAVAGVGDAAHGFAEVADRAGLDHRRGAVGGAVVDDQDLAPVRRVVRGEDRVDALGDRGFAVADGDDDRYEGVGRWGPRHRADVRGRLAAGAVELALGARELGRPVLGGFGMRSGPGLIGVGAQSVLGIRGGEDVLDGEVGLAGVGLGEAAAGRLNVADLLGEGAVREDLACGDALAEEGHLEIALEDADLAAGRAARLAAGVREGVPGAGEGAEVGAAAVSVCGEHRADAASFVDVPADDHAVGADTAEHGLLGAGGHCVDGAAETLGVVAALCHRVKE
jgi:hypothetical protein